MFSLLSSGESVSTGIPEDYAHRYLPDRSPARCSMLLPVLPRWIRCRHKWPVRRRYFPSDLRSSPSSSNEPIRYSTKFTLVLCQVAFTQLFFQDFIKRGGVGERNIFRLFIFANGCSLAIYNREYRLLSDSHSKNHSHWHRYPCHPLHSRYRNIHYP